MDQRYRVVTVDVDAPTVDTQYSFILPEGCMNVEVKLSDNSVAWRISSVAGVVAAGGGHPMEAGSSMSDEGAPHVKQTLYVAHSGSALAFKVSYLVPQVR